MEKKTDGSQLAGVHLPVEGLRRPPDRPVWIWVACLVIGFAVGWIGRGVIGKATPKVAEPPPVVAASHDTRPSSATTNSEAARLGLATNAAPSPIGTNTPPSLAAIASTNSMAVSSNATARATVPKNETTPEVRVLRSGSGLSKKIAITFDDGPNAQITPKILDVLKEHDVKATFFLLGQCVKANPEIAKKIVEEGHAVGNHTWNHRQLSGMPRESVEQQISSTQDEIRSATGVEARWVRPPYGMYRKETKEVFREHRLDVALWSVDPQDWRVRNRDYIIKAVTNKVENGSIILCHDMHTATLEAVPVILKTLKESGYEFTTLEALAESLPPPAKPRSAKK